MVDDIIDEVALSRLLRALGDDPEDLHELIDDFAMIGPQLVDELQRAAKASDLKSMRVSAHSLKSNAREFGARHLEQLCQSLEHECNEAAVQDPENQIRLIAEALQQAQSSLEEKKQDRA